MKIRNGFVSNSSSSSFHIYGTEMHEDDFTNFLLENNMTTKEKIEENGLGEAIEYLELPDLFCRYSYDQELVYIGRTFSSIGDDETGSQFKENSEKQIEDFFGKKKKCEDILESIYN